MLTTNTIVQLVLDELESANREFPPFNSMHEGYAVVLEELDEAWDEIKANDTEKAMQEMYQVAAMAVKFIEFCERHKHHGNF